MNGWLELSLETFRAVLDTVADEAVAITGRSTRDGRADADTVWPAWAPKAADGNFDYKQ